jgi:hypothetical protein
MGCSTLGKQEIHTNFGWENIKKREHFGDLNIHVRIILK